MAKSKKLPFKSKTRNDNVQHKKKLGKVLGRSVGPHEPISVIQKAASRRLGSKLATRGKAAVKRATKARKK